MFFFSEFEWWKIFELSAKIIVGVVKTAFYESIGTFLGFKKGEHVHSELGNSGEKISAYWGKDFPFVIYYDGK